MRVQLATLAAAALLVWLYAKVLSWCNAIVTSEADAFVLRPSPSLWAGLGAAIALGLFAFFVSVDLDDLKGTDRGRSWSTKMTTRGGVACVCLAVFLSFVAIRKHLTFRADSFVYQPDFAARSTAHNYAEITRVMLQPYEIPSSKGSAAHASYEPVVVLLFQNYDSWALVSKEFDIEQPEVLAAEISQRAHVPLQHSSEIRATPGGHYVFERALLTVLVPAIVVTLIWSLLELLIATVRTRRGGQSAR